MGAYAKKAANRNMEADAFELRLRAERRLGQMMAAQKRTVGFATTALRVARKRPKVPIVSLSPEAGTARQLALLWGAHSMVAEDIAARVGGAPPPTLRFLRVQPDHAGLQGGFARGTSDVQCTTISP
jgi:pyruvate kinase